MEILFFKIKKVEKVVGRGGEVILFIGAIVSRQIWKNVSLRKKNVHRIDDGIRKKTTHSLIIEIKVNSKPNFYEGLSSFF